MWPTLEKAPEPRRSDREKDLGGMSWPVLVFRGGNEALNERLTCPPPSHHWNRNKTGRTDSLETGLIPAPRNRGSPIQGAVSVPANVVANPNWQDQGLLEN